MTGLTKVPYAMCDPDVAAAIAAAVATGKAEAIAAASVKLVGDVVQTVHVQSGALVTGSVRIPQDDTIPQQSEGLEALTLAITPTSATNILEIRALINTGSSTANPMCAALFKDSAADAIAACSGVYQDVAGALGQVCLVHRMVAGGTAATTFKVRIGGDTLATISVNGSGARYYGGVMASSITITEIKA